MDPSAVAVAVTGAAGFVGQIVCRSLSEAGSSVRVLWGPPDDPVAARAAKAGPGLLADVTDASALARLVAGVSHVVHLAGPPSVVDSFTQPVRPPAIVVGTTTLLDVIRGSSVRRLVHVSLPRCTASLAAHRSARTMSWRHPRRMARRSSERRRW